MIGLKKPEIGRIVPALSLRLKRCQDSGFSLAALTRRDEFRQNAHGLLPHVLPPSYTHTQSTTGILFRETIKNVGRCLSAMIWVMRKGVCSCLLNEQEKCMQTARGPGEEKLSTHRKKIGGTEAK